MPVRGEGIPNLDAAKIKALKGGRSYIKHIPNKRIAAARGGGKLDATDDFGRLKQMDAIIVCVPTPLTKYREPDLQFIVKTGEEIAPRLRKGQLVVLESSTYPGTTRDAMKPILEATGLESAKDFWLAYSPEREDPGNANFGTTFRRWSAATARWRSTSPSRSMTRSWSRPCRSVRRRRRRP